MNLAELMSDILDHCCSNPVDYEEWMRCGQDSRKYNGWNRYVIETHCVLWKIIAKKDGDNWIVKEAIPEDC